jgi:hypothetical protein
VNNPLAATGWEAREDLDTIRFEAPRATRISGLAIIEDGYTNIAEEFAGVGRACVVRAGLDENIVSVYIWDTDGEPCDIDLCLEVEAELERMNPGDETVVCMPGLFEQIAPVIQCYFRDGYNQTEKLAEVEALILSTFSPLGKDAALNHVVYPGIVLYPDDFRAVLFGENGVDGLRRVEINLGGAYLAIPSPKLPGFDGLIVEAGP